MLITVNPLPTITGTLSVCVSSTSQLTGSATAATLNPWVSSNTGVATVSNTGLVTGVSAGTSTITYINTNGCRITATVTVNPKPTATISGTTPICIGGSTNLSVALTGNQPWSITYTDGTTPVTISGITTTPYNLTVSPSSTRTYSVTSVTDNTCTGSGTGTTAINVNALPSSDPSTIRKNLVSQLTSPVRWTQSVINMINDA